MRRYLFPAGIIAWLLILIIIGVGAGKSLKSKAKPRRPIANGFGPISCFWNNGGQGWTFTGTYNGAGQPQANAILPMNCSFGNSTGCQGNISVFTLWQATPWMPWTRVWTQEKAQISPCSTGNFNIVVTDPLPGVDGYYEMYASFNSCGYDINGNLNCDIPGMQVYYKAFTQFRIWQGKFVN